MVDYDDSASPRYQITLYFSASHPFHAAGILHWPGDDAAVNVLIRVAKNYQSFSSAYVFVIFNVKT
jgi:hypothetical protein